MAFRDKPRDAKGKAPAKGRSAGKAAAGGGDRKTGGKMAGKMAGKPMKKPSVQRPAKEVAGKPARAAPAEALRTQAGEVAPERISKLLARAGVASRRDIERMIEEGRVKLNGKVLDTPVVNVTLADTIEVDGRQIEAIERTRLWLYHKPAGLVTTNKDPEGRTTIFERLPADLPRVVTIGRLDINTEGLLLLTNDGGLARILELPNTGWLRRYRVRAHGDISQERLDELKEGIAVDGVLYGPIEATLDRKQGHNIWLTMGLREGKNREIKNVLGALGLDVNRLIRLSYGPFQLGDLAEGAVQEVRGRLLRDQLGPRLIEESGADFDAPIIHQRNAAPDDGAKPEPRRASDWKAERPARTERSGDDRGPARPEKPKWEKPGERSERLRGRLDTKREDGPPRAGDGRKAPMGRDDKGQAKRRDAADAGGRDDKRAPRKPLAAERRRASNVWIAPGARPMGPKKAAEKAEADARQAARDERRKSRPASSDRPDRNRDGGKPRNDRRDASAKAEQGARRARGRPGPAEVERPGTLSIGG
jgi:23S rRNA pseudouridine2605 synthase